MSGSMDAKDARFRERRRREGERRGEERMRGPWWRWWAEATKEGEVYSVDGHLELHHRLIVEKKVSSRTVAICRRGLASS